MAWLLEAIVLQLALQKCPPNHQKSSKMASILVKNDVDTLKYLVIVRMEFVSLLMIFLTLPLTRVILTVQMQVMVFHLDLACSVSP